MAGQHFTVVVKHDTYGFSFALQRDQTSAQNRMIAAVEKSSVPLWVSISIPSLECARACAELHNMDFGGHVPQCFCCFSNSLGGEKNESCGAVACRKYCRLNNGPVCKL